MNQFLEEVTFIDSKRSRILSRLPLQELDEEYESERDGLSKKNGKTKTADFFTIFLDKM